MSDAHFFKSLPLYVNGDCPVLLEIEFVGDCKNKDIFPSVFLHEVHPLCDIVKTFLIG